MRQPRGIFVNKIVGTFVFVSFKMTLPDSERHEVYVNVMGL